MLGTSKKKKELLKVGISKWKTFSRLLSVESVKLSSGFFKCFYQHGFHQYGSYISLYTLHFSENTACLPAWLKLFCLISLYAAIDLLMHLIVREPGNCTP